MPDFPPTAVREALLNAAVHGDHRTGRPIQVEHSPGWLTVTSPGPLVAGVTPQNILRHPHRARFRLLFTAFRHLGLVEQVGAGIDRMYREMLLIGRTPPRIHEDQDQVSVTFSADEPNIRIARFVNTLPYADRDDLDLLLVLGMLRRRRAVNAPAVAVEIQRPASDAELLLRRLSEGEQPLLEPTAGSSHRRQPNYRLRGPVLAKLGSAVAYHRVPSTERDRKIIEHLTEYGSINNRTVQNLFDVDVHRASAILRDLVERNLVVRTSDQTRGQSVRYGPGPGQLQDHLDLGAVTPDLAPRLAMAGTVAPDPTWIAAIHQSAEDFAPLGTAVVIDGRRILTSAHVVTISGAMRPELWVAFPMAEDPSAARRRAIKIRLAAHPLADLAAVEFEEPIPDGVAAAPLRCPKPADILERAWWAFGFAHHDPRGNEAAGTVGASLGYGWVRLDTNSRYPVEPGFSGGGLWCPDYGAVVGIVGQVNNRGDAQAITLHQADGYLPAERIRVLTQ